MPEAASVSSGLSSTTAVFSSFAVGLRVQHRTRRGVTSDGSTSSRAATRVRRSPTLVFLTSTPFSVEYSASGTSVRFHNTVMEASEAA